MGNDYKTILAAAITGCFIFAASLRLHERSARKIDEATKKIEFWSKWLIATTQAQNSTNTAATEAAKSRALTFIAAAANEIDPQNVVPRPFGWKRLFLPSFPLELFETLLRGCFYAAAAWSAYGCVLVFRLWEKYFRFGSHHRPSLLGELGLSLMYILLSGFVILLTADNVKTYCR